MNRYRFRASAGDWRPVAWPPVGPCWLSAEGAGYSIVVAYAPSEDDIRRQWPEASEIDLMQADVEITFSDRFPKPDWWPVDETAQLRDMLGEQLADGVDTALATPAGEVELAIEQHQNAVLQAEARILKARRSGNEALAAIEAEKTRAAAIYEATLERLARDRVKVAEDMQRSIATAEKLAAISRAALQAVQP